MVLQRLRNTMDIDQQDANLNSLIDEKGGVKDIDGIGPLLMLMKEATNVRGEPAHSLLLPCMIFTFHLLVLLFCPFFRC